jgi:hypothetical protein
LATWPTCSATAWANKYIQRRLAVSDTLDCSLRPACRRKLWKPFTYVGWNRCAPTSDDGQPMEADDNRGKSDGSLRKQITYIRLTLSRHRRPQSSPKTSLANASS